MFNTVKKLAKSVARNWTRPQMVRVNRRPKLVPVTKPAPVIDFDELREAVAENIRELSDVASRYYGCDEEHLELIDAATRLGFPEVAEFDEDQFDAFSAAVCEDYDGNIPDISEICEFVHAIAHNDYTFCYGLDTLHELGDKILEETIPSGVPEFIFDFISQEDVGEWWAQEHDGRFSQIGYFQVGTID